MLNANGYKYWTYFSSYVEEVIVLNRKPLDPLTPQEEIDLRGVTSPSRGVSANRYGRDNRHGCGNRHGCRVFGRSRVVGALVLRARVRTDYRTGHGRVGRPWAVSFACRRRHGKWCQEGRVLPHAKRPADAPGGGGPFGG
jgi:hypothetical protein